HRRSGAGLAGPPRRAALRRPAGAGLAGPRAGRTTPVAAGRRAGCQPRPGPTTERPAPAAPLRPERARGHALYPRPVARRPLLRPPVPAPRRAPAGPGHPRRSTDRPALATSLPSRCPHRPGQRPTDYHSEVTHGPEIRQEYRRDVLSLHVRSLVAV